MFTYIDSLSCDEFDSILFKIVEEQGIEAIYRVPGVYEILAEYYNKEVLEAYEAQRDEVSDDNI